MLCTKKIERIKRLIKQRGDRRTQSVIRISQMQKPLYDEHYLNFVNQLEKEH